MSVQCEQARGIVVHAFVIQFDKWCYDDGADFAQLYRAPFMLRLAVFERLLLLLLFAIFDIFDGLFCPLPLRTYSRAVLAKQ